MTGEGEAFVGNLSRLSQVRINTKSFMISDHTTILGFPKKGGQPYIPTSTGGGLVKNKPCFSNVDDPNDFIEFGMNLHYHTSDQIEDGGLFHQVIVKNAGAYYLYNGETFALGDFVVDKSTNATATNDTFGSGTGKIKLDTGADDEAYANIRRNGVPLSFQYDSAFELRSSLAGALTNYLWRAGVGCEPVGENNDPTFRMYCIEACPADAKMLIASSDGSTRSTLPTVYNVDLDNIHYWLLRHFPNEPKIYGNRDADFSSGNTTAKGNNIPTSNSQDTQVLFSAGVRTTVISAAKQMYHRGSRVSGMPSASWRYLWPQYPET